MKIVKLKREHLIEAGKLALENYKEECNRIKALPVINSISDLSCFVENEFGVAAFEDNKMLGFIGCFNPWEGAFDTNARGTFTPIHAHGCVRGNRDKIYQRMYQTPDEFENWVKERECNGSRIFVAKEQDKIIAFLEINDDAENLVTEIQEMKNICGAYCLSQYRGQMIVQNLLNYVINVLQKEGYKYLGVDYESFNPTAYHFWRKYFEPYTCSVTRRIDEGIMRKSIKVSCD